ncbi:MAG: hypothetical protein WA885_16930 [Phormidesmis sp.]
MSAKAHTIENLSAFNSDQTAAPRILIDAHVHIYDCFDVEKLLAAAWRNFHSSAGGSTNFTGILLLTETLKHDWFSRISAQISEQTNHQLAIGEWMVLPTAEAGSLKAVDSQGKQLFIIAGRQIITAEKLEVLALITDQIPVDGLSLVDTIQAVQAAGGIPVLPWAVGKWIGERGKLVEQWLKNNPDSPVFLGDNSGRPQFWSRPSYFQIAEQQRQKVLPGTDPLPLATEATRPGSFGLSMKGSIDPQTPGKALKSMLLDPQASWQAYGKLETSWRFLRNQAAIRTKR